MLSGSWSFASGIKHGTHIHTLGLIEGTGEARIFVLPVGKATLIENWDVLGLRATGSIDYRSTSVFVPEGYTHFAAHRHTEARRRPLPDRHHRLCDHVSLGLGVRHRPAAARRARENVRGSMGRAGTLATQRSVPSSSTPRPKDTVSRRACAGLRDVERVTHARAWRAVCPRGSNADPAGDGTCDVVGARGGDVRLYVGRHGRAAAGTLQRLFRDMHAGTQHITSSPPVFQAIGRDLAGLAPNAEWRFLDLVSASPSA